MSASGQRDPEAFAVEPTDSLSLSGESAGDGAPLLLLHGLTATRRNVVQGSRHLLSRGRRLIGYDARGHGESSPAPDPAAYEYADLAADAGAVVEQLGLDSLAIAGSSMGAATAVRYALEHPERLTALVLITPAYLGAGAMDAAALAHWDRLADALEAGDVDGFVDATGASALPDRWREPARLATRQRIERHHDLHAVATAVRVVPRSEAFSELTELKALRMPTLVVGSRDGPDPGHPLSVAERYAEHIPSAEIVVEAEGDTPLAWQGARLSRAIGDFLDRVQA
jgi:pimeloyl-ACP methyl ester carboxylesterase